MRKILIALLTVVTLLGCRKPAPQHFGVAVPGPANPVVPVDTNGNALGVAGNALVTTGGGGYVTVDGGSVTTTAGSVTVVQNDAGNPLPVDTEPGTALSTLVVQPVPAIQQVLIDAGTRCIQGVAFTNEGTITGYAQLFCGQYVLDAGGTAGAATAPNLQLRCPAGTICSISLQAPLCCAGATWYSGVDAGFLLQTSAPALTLTAAALR